MPIIIPPIFLLNAEGSFFGFWVALIEPAFAAAAATDEKKKRKRNKKKKKADEDNAPVAPAPVVPESESRHSAWAC